jgi:O-acetyl-ADP-ribose deacetylase (regulator of RNase III)
MGAGISVRFKQRYPEMYEQYLGKCRNDSLKPGDIFFYRSELKPSVFNLVTQRNLKGAKQEYLEQAVQKMFVKSGQEGITDIAMPEIGCGLGGMDVKSLKDTLSKYFSIGDTDITIYSIG